MEHAALLGNIGVTIGGALWWPPLLSAATFRAQMTAPGLRQEIRNLKTFFGIFLAAFIRRGRVGNIY